LTFSQRIVEATAKAGIAATAPEKFGGQLAKQGFVNIRWELVKWAVGLRPKGKKEKDIGRLTRENVLYISLLLRLLLVFSPKNSVGQLRR
jgi:hypothetical protein